MRLHLFEFEDLDWFPDSIRRGMMDYLRYFFKLSGYYSPAAGIMAESLKQIGKSRIVDLCSGGGGPVIELQQQLFDHYGHTTELWLTDLYPNRDSCRYSRANAQLTIRCVEEPVDAIHAGKLVGLRTLFSSVHHFKPKQVEGILADAVKHKEAVALFDIGEKNLLAVAGILVLHPILIVVLTPFFRPFRFSTLVFTYVVPVIPFCAVWDGVVSILRLYGPARLMSIAQNLPQRNYSWRAGKLRNKLGLRVTYLVGIPVKVV